MLSRVLLQAGLSNIIFEDDCTSLTGWTEVEPGTSDVRQITYDTRECFRLTGDGGDSAEIYRSSDNTIPKSYWLYININPDSLSSLGSGSFKAAIYNGSYRLFVEVQSDEILIYDGTVWNNVYTSTMTGQWLNLAFYVYSDGTVDTWVGESDATPTLEDSGSSIDAETGDADKIHFFQESPGIQRRTYINDISITRQKPF